MAERGPIPVIAGPTGAGKTAVAVELARDFPVEVVSADSRQIIRHLDIGTAKPTPKERQAVRFHLVDIIEPGERYAAYRFIDDANAAIDDIIARDKTPLLVGGTGLYLRALSEGIVEIENDDMAIRQKLEDEMEQLGPQAMYDRLEKVDPLEAARTHPNNKIRVIRALEVFYLTGRSRSELAVTGRYRKVERDFVSFCLAPERELLYECINGRVDRMLAAGLLDEVKSLLAAGKRGALETANVIGYNELMAHIDGRLTLEEAIAQIKQNHRRYAKRQLTWFRHQGDYRFVSDSAALITGIRPFLENFST